MVIKQLGEWVGRIVLGVILVGIMISWADRQSEKREKLARSEGYSQCRIEYDKKKNNDIIQNLIEANNKVNEVLKYTHKMKEKQELLSDDCKKIYNLNLTACRKQLYNSKN